MKKHIMLSGLKKLNHTMALRADAVQNMEATTRGIAQVIMMAAARTTGMYVKYIDRKRLKHSQGTVAKTARVKLSLKTYESWLNSCDTRS